MKRAVAVLGPWLAPLLLVAGTAEALSAQPAEKPRHAALEIAQQKAEESAIDTLPKQLKPFYKAHRAEMPALGVEPEFPPRSPERRFLVDRLMPFPFTELPRSEAALKAKYGDKAEGIGRLPWLIQESYARLVEAMKAQDKAKILAESDTLAGLVVDIHTVVNLSDNYDGQKSGQPGLYVRYVEKVLQYDRDLKLSPEAARYLDEPKEYVFSMLLATYVWLDNVLYLDDLAKRGKSGYSEIYFEDFAKRVGPILKDRLSRAAEDVGSYWYTAWSVAGRPELK
ncbi:MAG TPA: hypothetical protein VEQ10_11280 [Vicinamibacteria bacterium]|nr:hypothetical protein [Vicinamibacteria bacterium]